MPGRWHNGPPYYDPVLRRWVNNGDWVPYGEPDTAGADASPPPAPGDSQGETKPAGDTGSGAADEGSGESADVEAAASEDPDKEPDTAGADASVEPDAPMEQPPAARSGSGGRRRNNRQQ